MPEQGVPRDASEPSLSKDMNFRVDNGLRHGVRTQRWENPLPPRAERTTNGVREAWRRS